MSSSVTVVIPTYNRSWRLERAIRSALKQSHENLEVLVVDDCSVDDTTDVVRSFRDSRLVYHRQRRNVGMVSNWGAGLRLAAGTFVTFLADDDELGPDFVANRVHRLKRANATVVFSGYEIRDLQGRLIRRENEDLGSELVFGPQQLLRAALSRRWFIGSSLYRTDVCLEIWPALAGDDLVLDLGLNLRLALMESARGVYLPLSDFTMVAHAGQNSEAKQAQVFEQTSVLLERILEQLRDDDRARPVRRELASWHTLWGRKLAARGDVPSARSHFVEALAIEPRLGWPWKQLLWSVVWPRHLAASAGAGGPP